MEKLNEAGKTIGEANARVTLPELPGSCKQKYPAIPKRAGYEAVVAIKKGDQIIASANRDSVNCEGWYNSLAVGLAGGGAPTVLVPK